MKPRSTCRNRLGHKGTTLTLLVLGAMACHAQITIPTVLVGDVGNPNDSTGYGAVAYEYRIQTTEVNLFQYTAFLNAVAKTDTYSLYNTNMGTDLNIAGIARSGSSGSYTYSVIGSGNRPVTYVSWFDAARFANWVANGQPTGAQGSSTTENGAYSLLGAITGVGFNKNTVNPNTGTTTTYWIPSENEWYKAAYYDPSPSGPADDYWLYPTGSDSAPGNTIGATANQANYYAGDYAVTQSSSYSSSQNYLTDGGAFSNSASFYGTYDQGGNVFEWNDAVAPGSLRVYRGGAWQQFGAAYLLSSDRFENIPSLEVQFAGFRLSSVPEPSTYALLALGAGALWFMKCRRKARS